MGSVNLTTEQKAALTTGKDTWSSQGYEEQGVPSIRMSDGPNGLHMMLQSGAEVNGESIKAPCFPSAALVASSFDVELAGELGRELGQECVANGVDLLLGPGLNIKRSPLCGRNFEYYSEDPVVSGEMGTALVKGLQSQGPGACVKHFCANNQEYRRLDSSSNVDERTLREIYLPAFERMVKEARPKAIMASYNKVNGTYSTENKRLLQDILRDEWGYEGIVVSDWGATHDAVAAVKAGCDITMPGDPEHAEKVRKGAESGQLSEKELDTCADRIVRLARDTAREEGSFDLERGHDLARRICEESIVLLKNDGVLPIAGDRSIAFIGEFAETPHYQGGGSSHVNTARLVGALEAAENAGLSVKYAKGTEGIDTDSELLKEAVDLAASADTAVIFAGLPEIMEREGADRTDLLMPENHNTLISEVAKVNKNTIVVLHNGGPVEMPWVNDVAAILETYYGGEAVGEAVVNVLMGEVNPSGHLAETFPVSLSDSSSYLFFKGEGANVDYSERFFVGYRYSATKNMKPLFPFGHGLSYTSFCYKDLTADRDAMKDTEKLCVKATVKNDGPRDGKMLIQLYVAPPRVNTIRPVRELKRFKKVFLKSGEEKTVEFELSYRDFAHFEEGVSDFRVEEGVYQIQLCENAHEVRISREVFIEATKQLRPVSFNIEMPIKEFIEAEEGYQFIDEAISSMVVGLHYAGFISAGLLERIQATGHGKIDIKTLKQISQIKDIAVGENYDMFYIFDTTLSILANFLSPAQKEQMREIIAKENETQSTNA